ncbi:MAG: C25 family cysteine peptidase [Niabella sp.]
MIRKLLLILSFFACAAIAAAQQYNNEWIDYSKTYYKFKIGASGLYRIPQSVLAAANLGSTDVSAFQLFRNGAEVPVYTSGQSGVLPEGGYIEFWGEINDGQADLPLYRDAADQINNTRSLFADSATYFLTVNPGGNNKRLAPTDNTIPSGVSAAPYFMYTSGTYFNESIHLGPYTGTVSEPAYSASFEGGEGWASTEISENETRSFTQTSLYPYTGSDAPEMQVNMNVVGNSSNSRTVQLQLNGNTVVDTTLSLFAYAKLSKTLPVTALTGSTENLSVTNVSSVSNNRIKVAFVEITYPRVFNFGGAGNFRFKITPGSSSGKYLEISGFNYSGTPVLYDLTNGNRYEANVADASVVKVYVQPATGTSQELVLVNEASANVNTVSSLETRNFTDYTAAANQGDYLIITNTAILSGSDGSQPVEDYRAYRSSVAGGGYNAKVYLADQLTDQFGLGIRYSPLAIRNFIRYARDKYSTAPKSVFIVGRGIKYTAARNNDALSSTAMLNLVPTFGEPASDVLLAAEGSSSIPLTPIGRVSVINGDELNIYLEKVKQYEAHLTPVADIDGSTWKKNVAHMVGANDQTTIDLLYGYLNANKTVISDTLTGANVSDFVKSTSSTAAEQSSADRLAALINNGIGLLSYFGHSASNTLGFNLEDPENYSNQGKYPVFNMMGCNVGDIFILDATRLSGYTTISEKYVLAEERGCVGMMAGTSFGYVYPLKKYNDQFYKALSGTAYGNTLGDIMLATITNTFQATGGQSDLLQRAQCEEFVLNGDPAIKLYEFDKPDYAIEDQLVTVDPSFISIAESSFNVSAKLMNLGKAIDKDIVVELKRTYPDLTTKVIQRDTIGGIRYIDSLSYTIPIDALSDIGTNKITITIDPDNTIDELFETNNSITKEVYIYEDELRPVYPYTYAMVNKGPVTFYASTADPLAASQNYIIEVDTTMLFNSALKVTQTKTSSGGVIDFNPSVSLKDSTVYYWRVAAVAAQNEEPKWNSASFIYINGSDTGYSQSHYNQLLNNEYSQMSLDSASRSFVFDAVQNSITVKNTVWAGSNTQGENLRVYINDNPSYISSACGFGFVFNIFDAKSFLPWKNEVQASGLGKYDSRSPACSNGQPGYNFEYENNAAGRSKALQFLQNVPDGDLVVMRVVMSGESEYAPVWKEDSPDNNGNTLYTELVKQGFSTIDSFNRLRAVTFIYKNNGAAILAPKAEMGETSADVLVTTYNFPSLSDNGSVTSAALGPAKAWKQLQWDGFSRETDSKDSVLVDVLGVKADGTEDALYTGLGLDEKVTDISSIDAKTYPNLKLRMRTWDTETYTPYQLKYWRLYNTPVPEGAIAPNLFVSAKDTLDAGETLDLGVAFKNISDYPFDSIKVKMTIRDNSNSSHTISLPNQKALAASDTIKLQVAVTTTSYAGSNQLYVEFNPDDDQPEQVHFNNFLYKNFYVRSDSLNPYMDITFDGVHILNKDIVSSKPDILISLTDDAQYLLLNNSDLVKVQLQYPDGSLHSYSFTSDTLVLTPPGEGANDANTATINFKPYLTQDGEYTLIVSGEDESGNTAGNLNYNITFQVINKPMISNLLNYPNPFTTSTAFVFTLTGSEIPQNMRIQILTITGKIVREITKAELGTLHIGRNITEFKWDGTDQYGQKLANGVYLYRVLTNLNGKSLDKYTASGDNTDKYFNKGYGKMVLIR